MTRFPPKRPRDVAAVCASASLAGASLSVASHADDAQRVSDGAPVTTEPWREVVVSVRDLDATARFFLEIGRYETRSRGPVDAAELAYWGLPEGASGEALVVAFPGAEHGLIRLVRFDDAGPRAPMRPGARAWDTGCFFSLMIRMKDMDAIYDEALALGWWTETPITDLEFGTSQLRVVIYRGPDGVQVQGYERLTPPLPEAIPPFERMTQPFNVMQMVADREAGRVLFQDVLGFDTFYYGEPYVAEEPEPTPIGIPLNLTTSVRYRAGIVYPTAGEFGRLEMIDIMDLDGHDHSGRCHAPNYGILAVRYEVEDGALARQAIEDRGWPIARPPVDVQSLTFAPSSVFGVDTPDGAMIDFFEERPS